MLIYASFEVISCIGLLYDDIYQLIQFVYEMIELNENEWNIMD